MNLSSFGRRLLAAANGTVAGTILGLGTAAFKNTGTSGNTVPLLDGVNTWSGIQTFSANPSVTGGAISFPATQVPSAGANDLDDYEEGTFTPVVEGTTTAGAGTYSLQTGVYTKIGRVVFVELALTWTAHTGTGNIVITGLPFAAAAAPLSRAVQVLYSSLTYTGDPTALIAGGANTISPRVMASGAATALIAMDTAATIVVSGFYTV